MSCIARADNAVLTLIIARFDVKCFITEDCNFGLRVIQQWDDMLAVQRRTGLLAWPEPNPSNLLTWREKMFYVKWAALRGLSITALRTQTGQCVLHSAMLKGEPQAVKWLLYMHPELLAVCDEQRDSPVVIGLKELAGTLLEHQTKPTAETFWKRAKLAEILLSDQVQAYAVPWTLSHFRALGDCAEIIYF